MLINMQKLLELKILPIFFGIAFPNFDFLEKQFFLHPNPLWK